MKKVHLVATSITCLNLLLFLSLGGTRNPHGEINIKCEVCHTSSSWKEIKEDGGFDHNETGFPLIGAHEQIKCASCHRDLKLAETKDQCADCHNDIHRGKLGAQCQSCHTAESWENQSDLFQQHAELGFPLTGVHATADCNSCHQSGQRDDFAGTPVDCAGCHDDDFKATNNPDHELAGFSIECVTCHSLAANTWSRARYDHPPEFRLEGGHFNLECIACHTTRYAGTSDECFSCHESDFTLVSDPDHQKANFDHDCAGCHNITAWAPATFDHALTSFALTGAHANVDCSSCHSSGYGDTPADCYSCHDADFASADLPDHDANNFDHDCTNCHTTGAWKPSTFDHDNTRFTLTGAHQTVDCASCHTSGYTNMATDCYSCHNVDFASTDDPDHDANNFDHNCANCHSTQAWKPSTFDHDNTQFVLTGAHRTVDCASCHTSGYTDIAADCFSCHGDNFAAVSDPNHVSNAFPHECSQCHTTIAWTPAEPRGFDHAVTGFILDGAHAIVACMTCHTSGFTNTSPQCYSCHSSDFTAAVDPNHGQNNFDHDCSPCHTTAAWTPVTFDHNLTDFDLTGAHAGVACANCHAGGYNNTSSNCFTCHQRDFASASDPNHSENNFDHNCVQCHSTTAWEPSTFNHGTTEFPLTGAHVSVNCVSCHLTGYASTPSDCFSCHQTAFNGVTEPNHAQQNFSHDCTQCHSTTAWVPANFDHNATDFPLTGAHAILSCISCHSGGYVGPSTACLACHQQIYTSEDNPKHELAGFSTECQTCHTTTAWHPANWDHDETGFILTGAHVPVDCRSCHTTIYTGTGNTCFDCHQGNFASADDPDHEVNNFDHDCTGCHNTAAWEPAEFNHNLTGFPLSGAHAEVACVTCHANGYANTSSDCYSCHSGDFSSAANPNHAQNNFDHNCVTCHNSVAWRPSTFNHSTTSFPLTGAHTTVQCVACHSGGYVNTSADCFSCHSGDFNFTTSPNHTQNNFDHNCLTCHNTTAWVPSTFNHSTTGFALTGAHVGLMCIACHAQGYTSTSSACYDCHAGDFASVSDPNHVQNGFSHLCTNCHTTTAWSPATFDHNTTSFPLTGAHTLLQCIACHSGGYVGTSSNCYVCHQTVYESTTNPDHSAALFPAECQSCHTTTAWIPANWDHDGQYFPIYSGKHRNKWDQCTDCHVNPSNYGTFECIYCHDHNQTKMDDEHKDEPGYAYNSNACLNCHPNGSN